MSARDDKNLYLLVMLYCAANGLSTKNAQDDLLELVECAFLAGTVHGMREAREKAMLAERVK